VTSSPSRTQPEKRLHSSVFNKHHQTIKLAAIAEVSETETKFFDTILHEYKGERLKTESVQKQNKKIFTQPFVMQYYPAVPNAKPILINTQLAFYKTATIA